MIWGVLVRISSLAQHGWCLTGGTFPVYIVVIFIVDCWMTIQKLLMTHCYNRN